MARALRREGYAPTVTGSVASARDALTGEHWDAVLLDLGLPDGDGVDVAREIRAAGPTPVLMVTARDHVDSRVQGLDAGADDYLVKPFDRAELLARLRALLRRAAPAPGDSVAQIGDLVLDGSHRHVRRGTRLVQTTPLEYDVLAYLAHRPGTPVSREELLERVWHHDPSVPTNTVEVLISNVRRKLESGGEPRILHTIRGAGYALRA